MRRGLVLLALAAVLPLILFTAGLSFVLLREQQDAMRTEAVHRVEQMLASVERELFTQIELLKVLAQSPILDGGEPNLAAFHALAERFQSQLPLWHRIVLADIRGGQVMKTGVPYGAPLGTVVDPGSYARVLATGEPTIGDVVEPGGSAGTPRASFRVPVLRDGQIRFVLTGVVATERLTALLATPDLDPRWRPYLVDSADRIAAHLRRPELVGTRAMRPTIEARAAGSGGIYDGITATGEPLVTAFQKSARTGWSAHLAIPLALYAEPATRAVWVLSAAGLAAAGLSGVFALLLRRQFLALRRDALLKERALRMEALGRMTGGVAHDFNNLLMVILGNLEMLRRRVSEPRLERYLAAIRAAAERGAQLTRELLAFSRSQGGRCEVVDLNARLGSALDMIRQSVRGDIAVEVTTVPGRCPVRLDPLQLDLALLNLAANARDAMPEGGSLRIATRRMPLPDGSGRPGVALSVADSGGGVPPDALPHVFEPFFTTKAVGQGTGLGLSQVYGFAQAAGGRADIESRVGRGTTVTLHLPLATEEPPQTGDAAASAAVPLADGERIRVVLVDDNDEVRAVTAAYLAEAGCTVRQAARAEAGLDLLRQEGADVLVSDLVMPGAMDGLALAQAARVQWPDLPIVLVSGYSASAAAATELGFTLLMKPFEMEDLNRRIRAGARMRA